MGNTACCSSEKDEAAVSPWELRSAEAMPAGDDPISPQKLSAPSTSPTATEADDDPDTTYHVLLDKADGSDTLGLHVDYAPECFVLPITAVSGGLAEAWNRAHPESPIRKGDSILEVNGTRGDVVLMLEKCRTEQVLELVLQRSLIHGRLVGDLEELVRSRNCGPTLVRLWWHDACIFSAGELGGGCPNASMCFAGGGEGNFAGNAGLSTVALALLAPISAEYCPYLLSNADLWALAANVAIRVMGGPDIPTRFGRVDATPSVLSRSALVARKVGRLPDEIGDASHLRAIFSPRGFDDVDIVALLGAHTVGRCHLERSGFDGQWTEEPLKFDNSYFKEMLTKSYEVEATGKGCLQHRDAASGTIMLPSDLALLDPALKERVELYAADQATFFKDFTKAWVQLQENGCTNLFQIV